MDAQERLTVDEAQAPTLLGAMHVHRYEVAAELCSGLRVADLGCGSGYGGAILARACPEVVGIDLDERTIKLARKEFADVPGLEFQAADADDFLRDRLRDRFDAIVMLETLEHLENVEDVLVSLRRHAEDGVKLIVSVPNSRMLEEENPFHLTAFGYDEATEAFEGFPNTRTLFQFIAEGSLIRGEHAGDNPALTLSDEGEPEYANQFVVLVNFEEEKVAAASALMQLEAEPIHHRYVRALERANDALRAVNARLARQKLGTADSAAASLLARVRALEAEVAEVRMTDQQTHLDWIEDLHRQITERAQTIEEMESTRVWQLAGRYWSVRDRVRRLLRRN